MSVELPQSVTTLVDGDTTYYVVGTAHVSQRSLDLTGESVLELVRTAWGSGSTTRCRCPT